MYSHAIRITGQPNPLQNLGFYVVLFFVFGVFSGLIDRLTFLHVLRPMLVLGVVGLCIVIVTGRGKNLAFHHVGQSLILFTVWMICSIPTSVWRGGSFDVLINDWQKAAFTFFLAGGLVWDHSQCRKILHALGYASILLSVLALKMNFMIGGRLLMPNTRYANPNDLAMILLMALPCLGYMAWGSGGKIRKAIAIFGFIAVLICIAKTGSRAALIGAAAVMILVFFQVSIVNKFKLVMAASAVVVMAAAILPGEIRQRFVTIFGDEEGTSKDESAIGSSLSRKQLLLDSIYLTVRHPVFGVGPGMFPVAQNNLALERGDIRGSWHATHNTYTQVSSECGIPGLIFYLGAILLSFRSLRRIERLRAVGPAWNDLRLMANALRISMWSFCSVAFFASIAYLPFLPILCGLTVALEYVVTNRLAVESRTPAAQRTGMQRAPSFARV